MNYPAAPSPYPAPGEIIGDSWRIEKILGEGGMGAVARAWDLILHTPVAIKFMNPQFLTFPGAEERFINEGKASALIKSDHVVPVMKAGKTPAGTPYLVMECLEGVDLADLIARDGTPGLPVERSVHFLLQVLRALQAAHAIGIIHRDMKPSNCFAVNKDGEEDFVKILDFGISKIKKPGESASLTQTNSALGTPLYMSPEQARSPRDVDARSDIYSVGVILYECLTGHTPFFSESGEFTEILFKLFTAEPPPVQSTRPDLPDELAKAVHKALARDVNDRFSDALAFAEALAPFASERSKHVLSRMRAFKPPTKHSIVPPEDLPQSMVAFSSMAHGPQTDVMANRPTTDVMKGPPVTEVIPPAARVPQVTQHLPPGAKPSDVVRLSALPEAEETRARPEDAGARTQFDVSPARPPSQRPQVFGAQTDLSTARDTSAISQMEASAATGPRRRSPIVYALPIFAVLAIVGAVGGVLTREKDKGKTEGSATPPPSAVALPETSTAKTNVTPASAVVSAEPPASATASASASATAAAAVTTARTVVRPATPPPPPPPPPGTPHVLDTKIHQ